MDQHISFLLFSFFDQKDKWKVFLFMFLLPYLNNLFNKIYSYIFSSKKASITIYQTMLVSKDQNNSNSKKSEINDTYRAICWYLSVFYSELQTKLSCEDTLKIYVDSKYNHFPIYESTNSFSISYEKNMIEFTFSSSTSKDNVKCMTISSQNIQTVRSFVENCNIKYRDDLYNNYKPDKLYIFTLEMGRTPYFAGNLMKINKTLSNIFLPTQHLNKVKHDLDTFLSNKSFYMEKGIPHKRGWLLYGPNGTGKNSLVYALARDYKMNLYKWGNHTITRDEFRQVLKTIPANSIFFIDEIDMVCYNDRNSSNKESNKESNKDDNKDKGNRQDKIDKLPLSLLMEVLDGYDCLEGCLVILTTNHKELLDPSLIRPGRIDLHLELDYLNHIDIQESVEKFNGMKITVPPHVKMSASTLINQILLPHKDDQPKIEQLIINFVA